MICLSKADKSTFKHLSWNQSPPALSSSQTTRQDLNGISNLREYVDASQDDGGGGAGELGAGGIGEKMFGEGQPPGLGGAGDAGRWFYGLPSLLKPLAGGAGQLGSSWIPSPKCSKHLWGWFTWILSVLLFSFILTSLSSSNNWTPFLHGSASSMSTNYSEPTQNPIQAFSSKTVILPRRTQCTSGGISDKNAYNTPLHGIAILIVWFVSTLGCAFPILATKFSGLRIPRRFFFAVRHFGTGVLIATAFVHLLPTAFISLGDPCLGKFWNEDYPAMPGAIALAAIFLVTVIEMVFHPSRHVSPMEIASECCHSGVGEDGNEQRETCRPANALMLPVRDMGPLRGRSSSMGQGLSQLSQSVSVPANPNQLEQGTDSQEKEGSGQSTIDYSEPPRLSPELKQRKDRLQVILLEMGILFHSVFIGMALSVSIGNDFIVLLIAIVFHQTFEGLALGSRIAAIDWASKTWQPWLMALAYGCTTPLGQAIGLATHTLYSPDSEVGLILVGVMNAVSAGLLTFASLVELLSEDFLSDESWRYLRGKQRVIACLLVFFGAFFMSLVGAWA